jgi:hypothetical protein
MNHEDTKNTKEGMEWCWTGQRSGAPRAAGLPRHHSPRTLFFVPSCPPFVSSWLSAGRTGQGAQR